MSGYLESTRERNANENIDWRSTVGFITNPVISTRPNTMTESLLSYRSGAGYAKFLEAGATPRSDLDRYLDKPRIGDKLKDYGHLFDHSYGFVNTTCPKADFTYGLRRWNGPLLLLPVDVVGLPYTYTSHTGPKPIPKYSDSALNVLGAQGIAAAYPTKPQADLMVAIAELLREGLPTHVFQTLINYRGNSMRGMVGASAGEFLNLIFGVTPLLREIDKIIKTVSKTDQLIRQLVADSGNVVRRTRDIVDETTLIKTQVSNKYATIYDGNAQSEMGSYNNKVTQVSTTQTLSKRVWFAGAFQYWIPGLKDPGTEFQSFDTQNWSQVADLGRQLYGLQATPKAAWNLIPFSWLVDWFVNVSVLLENADNINHYGLVMPYGYVMAETKLITTTSTNFAGTARAALGWVGSSTVLVSQKRRPANPYGFGLKDVDLNPVQLSILAALGLSTQRGR